MIRKDQAHKHYDRNTRVIKKGDPDWRSDNHHEGRLGERYGTNVTSLMDQKIRQRAAREVDMDLLPSVDAVDVGDIAGVGMANKRDMMVFRCVEHVTTETDNEGVEYERKRRQWKYAWVEKNGAL